jgi:small nuclear ribonucleoprotein (snRNP)-like protein
MSFQFDKKIDIFDQEFWDLKQLTINGKLYAYSRTTKLVLELHIEDEGEEYSNRAIKLFGMRGEGKSIIRGRKIPEKVLKWCLKNKIQVFKNKPLFWL